jgi:hypothetical protein
MIRFASRIVSGVHQRLDALAARFDRRPKLRVVRTDELPERLSPAHLYVVGERGDDWFAAMRCPCGCGATIDLNLVPPGRPCWRLTIHADGSPSLSPSVCGRSLAGRTSSSAVAASSGRVSIGHYPMQFRERLSRA